MLENLFTLDVFALDTWQWEAAEQIWRDFTDTEFQFFHRYTVDPARIELDKRVVRDMPGLDSDAEVTVERLRLLSVSEPSIHGSKKSELPPSDK
jgi:hypothetical protein